MIIQFELSTWILISQFYLTGHTSFGDVFFRLENLRNNHKCFTAALIVFPKFFCLIFDHALNFNLALKLNWNHAYARFCRAKL